jgi:hypothetical protein
MPVDHGWTTTRTGQTWLRILRMKKLASATRNLERAKGFEPSTPTLARSGSCFNALPHEIGAVYKKRAGYSADITMTQ